MATYISTPSWWRSTALTPKTDSKSFLNLANALIPYYTNPDQINTATFLGADASGAFSNYLGITPNTAPIPGTVPPPGIPPMASLTYIDPTMNRAAMTSIDNSPAARYANSPYADEARREVLSSDRASQALAKLTEMQRSAGLTDDQLGPGYKFIRQALSLLQSLGINSSAGEQGMTRAEFESMQSTFQSMMRQAESEQGMAPYAELASKFINPTVIGTLMPSSTYNGNTTYGFANRKLFR